MKSKNKKTLLERTKSIIITILVVIIILLSKCNGDKGVVSDIEPKIVTETIVKVDTVTVTEEKVIPKWRTKVIKDTIEVEKIVEADTISIIKEYLEKFVYIDTIMIDTIGFIAIEDTIFKNEVIYRKPSINIEIPNKTVNIIQKVNEREYYIGLGTRTTMNKYTWMGLEGSMRTKKGNIFLLGVGTDNENNFSLGGSVHWKIMNK
jgi:hypothetical protein